MYDPFASFSISCDWECHVTRTPPSGGGTDYRMSVGTPIYAAFDGVLTNRPPVQYPASGNVAILTRADGLAFYHLHLSRFVTPGLVKERQLIGYSGGALGAPGSGASTGPHVHVNAYFKGVIRDIHDFFTTTAGSGGTPITGDEMALTTEERGWLQNLASAIPSIVLTLKDVDALLAMVQTPVNRDKGDGAGVVAISQLQDNADTNTLVRDLLSRAATPGAAVDLDALATKIVAQLKPLFDALPAAVRSAIIK